MEMLCFLKKGKKSIVKAEKSKSIRTLEKESA